MRSFALEAFAEVTGWLLWLGLLHSVWIGLFIAAGVALILQAGPRLSHRARHAILLLAMAGVAVGPIVVAVLFQVVSFRASRIASSGRESTEAFVIGEAVTGAAIPVAVTNEHKPGRNSGWTPFDKTLAWAVDRVCRIRWLLIEAWLASMACLSAVLAMGMRRVRRVCWESEPAALPIQQRTRRLARRLRLGTLPRIQVHPTLAEPFLCGLFRPVIVLPGRWLTTASPERLDAILAHELAHARRLDHLVNLAQRLVEVALFFHPAVHWLSRSLRRERELCTDALAVRVTRDPLALAEALQSVARLRLHFRSPMGMPIAGTSLGGQTVSLLSRIQELIGMTPTRPRRHFWPFATLPAAGIIALVATAAGLARDDPPGSSAAALHESPLSGETDSRKLPCTERQIAYGVRFCRLPVGPWRELLLDRIQTIKQEADVSAWIMDDKALFDFLKLVQNDTQSNVLQAPKVTAFEGAHAVITSTKKTFYVASVERVEKGFRPVVKHLDVGMKLDLTGTHLPRGTRLSVDVSHSSLLGFHTLVRKAEIDGKVQAAQYQVPTALNRRCQVSCDLHEGSFLVISTGLSEEHEGLSGIAGFASDALESVGLPKLDKSTTYEQLVIVNTRRIDLEPEKPPVHVGPVSKIESRGSTRR